MQAGRDSSLLDLAKGCAQLAQAPYSGHKVGVAVKLEQNGPTFIGCNVEKETYAQPICPELIALEAALAGVHDHWAKQGVETPIEQIAIHFANDELSGDVPCGSCVRYIKQFAPLAMILTRSYPEPRPISAFKA